MRVLMDLSGPQFAFRVESKNTTLIFGPGVQNSNQQFYIFIQEEDESRLVTLRANRKIRIL